MPELIAVFFYQSSSSAETQYQTLLYKDGSTSCDCPGWKFKRRNAPARTCKHTREVETDQALAQNHAINFKYYGSGQRAPRPAQRELSPIPRWEEHTSRAIEVD